MSTSPAFPFPASVDFEGDAEVTPTVWRVYRFLRLMLDFAQIREVPSWYVAENTGIKRQHVGKALTWLRDRGYVTEHPRERPDNQPRRFTLAWSAHPVRVEKGEDRPLRAARRVKPVAASRRVGGPQLGLPLPTLARRGAA